MAFNHGSQARAQCNGYDLSAYLKSVTVAGTNDMADVTALSNTAKSYLGGLHDATLTAEGMFDPTDGRSDTVLRGALDNAAAVWTHFPAGTAIGARGRGLEGFDTSYEITTAVDDAALVSAEAQSSTGPEGVTVHRSGAAVTGGGTATVQDNAASSANGGVAFLQALSLNGGTAVVKVQHSADNITYADLITFPDVTSVTAPLADRVAATGTVDRYTRATWTITGGTADFIVAFGRK